MGLNEVININCYHAPGAVPINTDFSVAFSWSAQPAPVGPSYGYLESNGGNGTITQFDSGNRAIVSTLPARAFGMWSCTV